MAWRLTRGRHGHGAGTSSEEWRAGFDMSQALPAIPIVDIRQGGPPDHARRSAAGAYALREACLRFFPRAVLPLVPALDLLSRRSLKRSRSPYFAEIAQIAAALELSGVWLLNASYQWGCTARADEHDGVPWLLRTLDWPFRGLGRHTEIARMRGDHGDFFSVTWPGYVGALTAMAPQRFAAALNQAPMWRHTAASLAPPCRLRCQYSPGGGRHRPDAAGSTFAPGI